MGSLLSTIWVPLLKCTNFSPLWVTLTQSTGTLPSENCFGSPITCHNCIRKNRFEDTQRSKKENLYQRCSGCLILSYCDRQCQTEHWWRVHKGHCRGLLRQTQFTTHNQYDCQQCIEEYEEGPDPITSYYSPKAGCYKQKTDEITQKVVGETFGFHKRNPNHGCKAEFQSNLPTALYKINKEPQDNELDGLIVHIQMLLEAIITKLEHNFTRDQETINLAIAQYERIIRLRIEGWTNQLIYGDVGMAQTRMIRHWENKLFWEPTIKLGSRMNPNDAWWKALAMTCKMLECTINTRRLDLIIMDIESSREFKLCAQRKRGELKWAKINHQANRTDKWMKSMPWPTIRNNKLILVTSTETENWHRRLRINKLKTSEREMEERMSLWRTVSSCDHCLKYSRKTHRCTTCKSAQYCGKGCQISDMQIHKHLCTIWKRSKIKKVKSARKKEIRMDSTLARKEKPENPMPYQSYNIALKKMILQ